MKNAKSINKQAFIAEHDKISSFGLGGWKMPETKCVWFF